ncbi:hypothetical protein HK097_001045 [Rhizophlyctis rosea]|uniref:ER-bound oxygenase mpaB/mpaB'/Rubber oxygenase catalytic domain-containing protein n=1 Tax=Rhizophlyctis rosea TaxID=64517 RepID=A0AAD5X6X4_9FUNG|nr:hypothetical protein HK097_001045 [Rhizophlyctis rosea]
MTSLSSSSEREWVDFTPAYKIFRVPSTTPSPIDFAPLVTHGDPPADTALASLTRALPSCPIRIFDTILDRCAAGTATPEELAFMDEARRIPNWVDWAQIRRGQEVFWRHTASMCMVLLYGTLAGGFSNPRINKTLVSTGYLSDPVKVKRRIFETAQMVFDAADTQDGLQPGSEAWKSVLRVRLLHASVRARAKKKAASRYDEAVGDLDVSVPINQADMIGTALGFQCSVIMGLTRMCIYLNHDDRESYTHLWRYMAHLSGIKEEYNPLAYGFASTVACLRTYLRLYFAPDPIGARLSATVLSHVTKDSPKDQTIGFQHELGVAISRIIIGPTLADALDMPKVGMKSRLKAVYVVFLLWLWSTLTYVPWLGPKLISRRKKVLVR